MQSGESGRLRMVNKAFLGYRYREIRFRVEVPWSESMGYLY